MRKGYMGKKVASWYGPKFHGKLTASGEIYNMNAMTCAHKSLPLGTILALENVNNGKTARVTVTDRGPYITGRDIDLSKAAAKKLGIIEHGTGKVKTFIIGRDMRYSTYIKNGRVSGGPKIRGYDKGAKVATPHKSGHFTIQVASLSDKRNAKKLRDKLRRGFSNVYVKEKTVNGTKYYRVRVGRYGNKDKAEFYKQRLVRNGYSSLKVMTYER